MEKNDGCHDVNLKNPYYRDYMSSLGQNLSNQ